MLIILQVAIATPLDQCFDYLPIANQPIPKVGARVKVPFGRRYAIGVVTKHLDKSDFPHDRLREINSIIDHHPLLPAESIKLLTWLSGYYHHPIGETILSCLPPRLRQGKDGTPTHYYLTADGVAGTELANLNKKIRAPKQHALCELLAGQAEGYSAEQLREHGFSRSQIDALIKKSWVATRIPELESIIDYTEQPKQSHETNDSTKLKSFTKQPALQANSEQQAVIDAVISTKSFACHLCAGVTGSGKTEVYLQIIAQWLQQGKQALVLIPEISLSPQTVKRFQDRFNVPVATYHSGLNATQRANAWNATRRGQARILIGTRSALLCPIPQLGGIIVDEEHDGSYKQQANMRYQARDVAIRLAQQRNIPILLGSATPSLESWHNARQGKFQLHHLHERATSQKVPQFITIDQRQQKQPIHPELIPKLKQSLAAGEQILIFLNRRGYAPVLMCHGCGWHANCPHCDAKLTFHHSPNKHLRCHHCDWKKPPPDICPECKQTQPKTVGVGTQQVEQFLHDTFAAANILRIDRDTTQRKGELQKRLQLAHSGEANILLGTQMLAKGHHFPMLSTVVIVNADSSLFSSDYRGSETLAQLIHQVGGRAGRGEKPGQVWLQTRHPNHQIWPTLLQSDYNKIADYLLEERRQTQLPPCTNHCLINADASSAQLAESFLQIAKKQLDSYQPHGLLVHGPFPATMERVANRFRAQLWCQSDQRPVLHAALNHFRQQQNNQRRKDKCRWFLDVDAQNN